MTRVTLDLNQDACDKVVVTALKEDIKTIKAVMKRTGNDNALEEHQANIDAMKRVLAYYGVTIDKRR